MSSNLFWSPPPEEVKEHCLDLKYEIGQYLDEDYNGGQDSWTVGKDLIPFLKGICTAGSEHKAHAAEELIAAIERYGTVILTIH